MKFGPTGFQIMVDLRNALRKLDSFFFLKAIELELQRRRGDVALLLPTSYCAQLLPKQNPRTGTCVTLHLIK